MKAKLFLVALNLMLLLIGCDIVTCVEPGLPKKTNPQFTGEWQWFKTYNGWGTVETPATKGYSETILFGADNLYKKFRDGTVTEESPYYIVKEKSAVGGPDSVFVYYLQKQHSRRPLFLISADTLHTRLSEACNDCPEEYYVRKKVTSPN